jgi:hypothetical protein
MLMWRGLLTGLALAVFGFGRASVVAAQAAVTADSAVTEAQLAAYAKAYVAIGSARDSAHAHMALSRNKTNENQRALRDTLKAQIEQILRDQGLTMEQYTRITFVISRDETRRKRFQELLAAAAPKPDPR